VSGRADRGRCLSLTVSASEKRLQKRYILDVAREKFMHFTEINIGTFSIRNSDPFLHLPLNAWERKDHVPKTTAEMGEKINLYIVSES
jgi:hypothetical protein